MCVPDVYFQLSIEGHVRSYQDPGCIWRRARPSRKLSHIWRVWGNHNIYDKSADACIGYNFGFTFGETVGTTFANTVGSIQPSFWAAHVASPSAASSAATLVACMWATWLDSAINWLNINWILAEPAQEAHCLHLAQSTALCD